MLFKRLDSGEGLRKSHPHWHKQQDYIFPSPIQPSVLQQRIMGGCIHFHHIHPSFPIGKAPSGINRWALLSRLDEIEQKEE